MGKCSTYFPPLPRRTCKRLGRIPRRKGERVRTTGACEPVVSYSNELSYLHMIRPRRPAPRRANKAYLRFTSLTDRLGDSRKTRVSTERNVCAAAVGLLLRGGYDALTRQERERVSARPGQTEGQRAPRPSQRWARFADRPKERGGGRPAGLPTWSLARRPLLMQ